MCFLFCASFVWVCVFGVRMSVLNIYVCVCFVSVCMFVSACACVCVCMHVCLCVNVCV